MVVGIIGGFSLLPSVATVQIMPDSLAYGTLQRLLSIIRPLTFHDDNEIE